MVLKMVTQIGLLEEIRDNTAGEGGGSVSYTVADYSGVILLADTSQEIAAANSDRHGVYIQALSSNTESIWLNYDAVANRGLGSFELNPGDYLRLETGVADKVINVISETAGQGFTVKGVLVD